MLFVLGVSGTTSTTSPRRQSSLRGRPATLVAPVALLAPGVPVVVVAQRLPEAGDVVGGELQAPHPLGALPEVQVRAEQARRAAVLGLEGRPLVGEGDPRLAAGDLLQR